MVKKRNRKAFNGAIHDYRAPTMAAVDRVMSIHGIPYAPLCEAMIKLFLQDYKKANRGGYIADNHIVTVESLKQEANNSIISAILDFCGSDSESFLKLCENL